ncbi:MAG: UvrB/UvrC motif-containing protein [Planctomycetota bacterium]|jgi:protein arginine kinase activator
MFICEVCKKNPATVHLTDIHNNEKKELHLCQGCAEDKGISFQHNFSLPELLSELTGAHGIEKKSDLVCEACGLSFSDFQARGRFGCANDYKAFRDELIPMIERIHGKTRHMGKVPKEAGKSSNHQNLMDLQKKMKAAIEREAYEEAAEIRDQINRIKKDVDKK